MPLITEIRRKLPTTVPAGAGDTADRPSGEICQIRVDDIIPNRSQPRSAFNQNAIARLADSIRRYGILQPLTVRRVLLPTGRAPTQNSSTEETVMYELIAGERRLRAAKLAELATVPCIIINTDDATSAELAIIENLLRENLNMFEQAEAFARLIREFHLTQDEAARRVSMSQSAVANKLRLLRLTQEERETILSSGLTERHARALLKLNDPALRRDVLGRVLERHMNVSATECYIEEIACQISRFQSKQARGVDAVSERVYRATEAAAAHESEMASFPREIQALMETRRTRFKGAIKDMQLFYNSVRNAVGILETAGIAGTIQKEEQEDRVVLTITLSRSEG